MTDMNFINIVPADVQAFAADLDLAALLAGSATPPSYTPTGWSGTKTASALRAAAQVFSEQTAVTADSGATFAMQARTTAAAFSESDSAMAAQLAGLA